MTAISGTRVDLAAGDYTASIASVGASLRELRHRGRDLVVPFGEDEVRPLFRGATLVPWPNRVVDGRYSFDGADQRLALTEPARGHALHGLVAWTDFAVAERTASSAILAAEVVAQEGYPHRLAVTVEYRLTADGGLVTRVSARNTGPTRAPYGSSGHPYLVAGEGRVDDWTLRLAADRVLEVDDVRLIPQGTAAVAGGPFDFSAPRAIGDLFVDHAFTGHGSARLTAADGHGVEMLWDAAAAPWVQVHTGDRPEPAWNRAGLAVEPMTCPPDAFNSGEDLILLEPGESHALAWTIAAVRAPARSVRTGA